MTDIADADVSGVVAFDADNTTYLQSTRKSQQGKLRTGLVAAQAGKGAKGSIPTRYETILNQNQREQDAFGRRTCRFDEPVHDLPGPGSYRKSRSILSQSAHSFSKQGSSAFAKPVGLPSSVGSLGPGPGAYTASIDIRPVQSATTQKTTERPSAVFAGPSAKPVVHTAKKPGPPLGPGEYFSESSSTLAGPCAAMTSKAARCTSPAPAAGGAVSSGSSRAAKRGAAAAPPSIGPGSYETTKQLAVGVREPNKQSHFMLSGINRFGEPAAHQSHVGRILSNELPPILAASHDVDRLNVPPVVKEVRDASRVRRERALPQDGTIKPSPMFCESNADRFGRPIVRYRAPPSEALGPGSYELEKPARRMLISSAWALSGSTRDGQKDRYQPPGPAYYNPSTSPGRVSHRVNDGNWF